MPHRDTTIITSSVLKGYMENGRRYASGRDGNYYCPSDEKQFEVFYNTHLLYLILDSQHRNPLFRSPIDNTAQDILDLGTGDGIWCVDVAEKMPHLVVKGIDLFPPPTKLVPPNCILEDLKPEGWIEQLEIECHISCGDGTMPADSLLANFGKIINECAVNSGKPIDSIRTFRSSIENASFVNVHETNYKVPIGNWPKHPVYKDAGSVATVQFKEGPERWIMFFLTTFAPKPWTAAEVLIYVAKMRREVDQGWHIYQHAKRVWAQKPYDAGQAAKGNTA